MRLSHAIDIAAPIDVVWDIYTAVERWPQWMESMDHVDIINGGDVIDGQPLAEGSEVWISQPELPAATWRVTQLEPGREWTWVSQLAGSTTTATHRLSRLDATTTRVTMELEFGGALGGVAGRLRKKRIARAIEQEGEGLRAACEEATRPW